MPRRPEEGAEVHRGPVHLRTVIMAGPGVGNEVVPRLAGASGPALTDRNRSIRTVCRGAGRHGLTCPGLDTRGSCSGSGTSCEPSQGFRRLCPLRPREAEPHEIMDETLRHGAPLRSPSDRTEDVQLHRTHHLLLICSRQILRSRRAGGTPAFGGRTVSQEDLLPAQSDCDLDEGSLLSRNDPHVLRLQLPIDPRRGGSRPAHSGDRPRPAALPAERGQAGRPATVRRGAHGTQRLGQDDPAQGADRNRRDRLFRIAPRRRTTRSRRSFLSPRRRPWGSRPGFAWRSRRTGWRRARPGGLLRYEIVAGHDSAGSKNRVFHYEALSWFPKGRPRRLFERGEPGEPILRLRRDRAQAQGRSPQGGPRGRLGGGHARPAQRAPGHARRGISSVSLEFEQHPASREMGAADQGGDPDAHG